MHPIVNTLRFVMAPVAEGRLAELPVVYTTNPSYIALTEGPSGYNLGRRRDWHPASITPGLHLWRVYRKDDETLVGVVEFFEGNPNDGYPWIGLLMIRGDCHKQGYGTEALEGLLSHSHNRSGWDTVRIGIVNRNEAAFAWWPNRGFQIYGRVKRRLSVGETEVVCMQRQL